MSLEIDLCFENLDSYNNVKWDIICCPPSLIFDVTDEYCVQSFDWKSILIYEKLDGNNR